MAGFLLGNAYSRGIFCHAAGVFYCVASAFSENTFLTIFWKLIPHGIIYFLFYWPRIIIMGRLLGYHFDRDSRRLFP